MTSHDRAVTVKQVASKLGIGPNILFRILRSVGVFHGDGHLKNTPVPRHIKHGYFYVKVVTVNRGPISIRILKTMVTPTGVRFLEEFINALEESGQLPHKKRLRLHRKQIPDRGENEVYGVVADF